MDDGMGALALTGLLALAAGGIARADDVLKAKVGVFGCRRRRRCSLRRTRVTFVRPVSISN